MNSMRFTPLLVFVLPACISGAAFGGDSEQAISSYLMQKQVIAAADLAEQISSTGKTRLVLGFDAKSPRLSIESAEQLRELATLIKSDRRLVIAVGFRSGPSGQQLAKARARSVVNALLAQGANAKQVRATNPSDPTALAFNELVQGL